MYRYHFVIKFYYRERGRSLFVILLLLFFRLKSTCSLRLWCFTHHATNSFGTSIMVGFVYLLLAYLHATSLLIFCFFFPCHRLAAQYINMEIMGTFKLGRLNRYLIDYLYKPGRSLRPGLSGLLRA